ncbi:MAG: methyltransferase type 11 [Chloroflexi bacterium]|nr:MAG: methyltransferase type 11 [Chloroflexota bacterium]
MNNTASELDISLDALRAAIQSEYEVVAKEPGHGFHFHTGRSLLTEILDYDEEWLDGLAGEAIESAAGTGNPFRLRTLAEGERVVDVGSGAGIDSLIAAKMVGPTGYVVGVDMTPAMVNKARRAAQLSGLDNIEFCHGYAEEIPVPDGWADVVISNGVLNLFPNKLAGLQEMLRVLKPGGRLQIADILVEKPVPAGAKNNIDLWTG